MLADGAVLQNQYRIERKLSDKGGMGLVYLATDLQMEYKVVVKQSIVSSVEYLRQNKNYRSLTKEELLSIVEASRKAFEREAKLLFGLNHKALPRVTSYFVTPEGEQFFVMDFIPGRDLGELLDDRQRQNQGPFPLNQVLSWADQILDALHYLHTEFDEPIIHRDIKPQNLKLTPNNQIVLLDFGLAKGARPGMTVAESILAGTKEYAPIEQLDDDENSRQKTDPRSDLYSLSMTLHHLLSGQLPAKTISRVSAKAEGKPDPLRPIHELVPTVPETVSAVLQRAASVFAKGRLTTAAEMRLLLRQAVASPPPKPGNDFVDDLNGVRLEMVRVPGGTFKMGSPEGSGRENERPQHEVTVPTFLIGKFTVTQAQWKAVMGDQLKPAFNGDNLPMESVSWEDAKEFYKNLAQMTNKSYRLPSEAEWEYACRAGTTTEFAFGDSLSSDQANFDGNFPAGGAQKSVYRKKTTPVGSFEPNAFGLFDLQGNVWEWCEDVWHSNYKKAPSDGTAWLRGGDSNSRVLRGGSWIDDGSGCRSANRLNNRHSDRNNDIGFRVVVSTWTPNP